MVTKKELYDHPMVVKRILEEVEKQRGEKFEDLEFLNDQLRLNSQAFGFTWFESKEGASIWAEIYSNSNFQPFYEFHGITNQTYTAKQVIDEDLALQIDTMEEVKRIIPEFQKYGKFDWLNLDGRFNYNIEDVCFQLPPETGMIFRSYYKYDKSKIINSKQVVTSKETTITEKTQIDPNDLKEGDIIFNPFYTYKPIVITKGTDGDLYGIDSTGKKAFQVFLSHFGNSFTPYNIVTGGATFERPVVYPKDGEVCFMKSETHDEITSYSPIYFDSRDDQEDKECFRNGTIITAEEYLKKAIEYNNNLKL